MGSEIERDSKVETEAKSVSVFEPMTYEGGALLIPQDTARRMTGMMTKEASDLAICEIGQIAISGDDLDVDAMNRTAAVIAEIGPQDAIEGMLAMQMVAIHQATIRHSRKLMKATSFEGQRLHESAVNKLARTFAAQTEALRKHRYGGEQVMRVERVTVNEGGQAIVGNVNQPKGGEKNTR